MKRAFIILTITFICTTLYAQGKWDANWCFGYRCGIDFNDTANPINFLANTENCEANAVISDSLGNLLFYFTNGNANTSNSLKDKAGNTIPNSDHIISDQTITNGVILLPIDSYYYILTLGYTQSGANSYFNLYYTKVEMDSVSQWRVSQKNVLVSTLPLEEKLSAVKDANGKDWWIVTHRIVMGAGDTCNTTFVKFNLSKGVFSQPYLQQLGTIHCSYVEATGESRFSRDGKYFISTSGKTLDYFEFDRCSGLLSNHKALSFYNQVYGCDFSGNGKIIYATTVDELNIASSLYQYYVDSSKYTVLDTISNTNSEFGQVRLAWDNKIYITQSEAGVVGSPGAMGYNQFLSVINKPDSIGTSSHYQYADFGLGLTAITCFGLPNFANYNLGKINTSIWRASVGPNVVLYLCDSIKGIWVGTDSITGVIYDWHAAQGIDDPHLSKQLLRPDASRWYYVTFTDTTITGSCQNRTDSVYVEVKPCTGINEPNNSLVTVFPNPAQNTLTVEWLEGGQSGEFMLYDLLGRMVLQQKISGGKALLDIGYLPAGAYLYRLNSNGKLIGAGKVMK